MAPLINELPSPYLAHLVDAIGELIAAVFDVHLRGVVRNVAAVYIGDA
jgi:hypothetical protein